MRSGNYDEYRFDPELEDGHVAREFTLADEYREPKEFDAVTTAKAADKDEKKKDQKAAVHTAFVCACRGIACFRFVQRRSARD